MHRANVSVAVIPYRAEMAESMRRHWVFDPHSGGVNIPPAVRARTVKRIEKYAAKHYVEPEKPSAKLLKVTGETWEQFLERLRSAPIHLCRLRHFAEDRWSMAFFTYSHERYEPSVFANGSFHGSPEEAFELAAMYLR
jgi:hypothetical protein